MTLLSELDPDILHFLPLSGCGEFGPHCNLYIHGGKILIIDMGIGFPDETQPGVNILLPDVSFLEENREAIVGLVITHSHEDHIGGIQYLWDRIGCPVFATPHDIKVLKNKLRDAVFTERVPLFEVAAKGTFDLEPFSIEMIETAHSTPESNMLLIGAGGEKVLHTGDWKLDDEPVIGPVTDIKRLEALGDESVLAMIGDSTNVIYEGHSLSEGALTDHFVQEFQKAEGRVIVTCISSSTPRVKNIMQAAKAAGRSVSLAGRSLWTRYGIGKEMGHFDDMPDMVPTEEALRLSEDKVIFIVTGSQGESRAAMSRIAHGTHHQLRLKPSDTIYFSSRVIPGNEKNIFAMQNAMIKAGCNVITPAEANIYASGHPCKEEMRQLYEWVRPHIAVPVHGDHSFICDHAELAEEVGCLYVQIPNNGEVIALTREDGARVVAHAHTGFLANDGNRVIDTESAEILRERRKMGDEGLVSVSVILDKAGRMQEASVNGLGLVEDEDDLEEFNDHLIDNIEMALDRMNKKRRGLNADTHEVIRLSVRRLVTEELGKRPMIVIHMHAS